MSNSIIENVISRHESLLNQLINEADIPAQRIKEAMLYSLFPGGKRIRPLLVYFTGIITDAPAAALEIIGAAVEITHCYSLIHDDLPSMDNDDFRRGKLSCHRAFDEATAILAGDGMQALAIELLLAHLPKILSENQLRQCIYELVKATGPSGMVSGQSLDLSELSKSDITESKLVTIHQLKTGKLISACVKMSLAAGQSTPNICNILERFAEQLGILFQMQDDYLDYYGQLGKYRASDAANNKLTFATLYSQQDLKALLHQYYQRSYALLSECGKKVTALEKLLESLQQRLLEAN